MHKKAGVADVMPNQQSSIESWAKREQLQL